MVILVNITPCQYITIIMLLNLLDLIKFKLRNSVLPVEATVLVSMIPIA